MDESGSNEDFFDLVHPQTIPSLNKLATIGNVQMIKELLDKGHSTLTVDNRGWNALHCAVHAGHFECVKLLINQDDIDINKQTYNLETSLLLLILTDRVESCSMKFALAEMLLKAGACPNAFRMRDNGGGSDVPYMTILNAAIDGTYFSIAELLLKYGADVNQYDDKFRTILHSVPMTKSGFTFLLVLLKRNDLKISYKLSFHHTFLHKWIYYFDEENLSSFSLLLKRADSVALINERDYTGYTLLHIACEKHLNVELINILLNHGADPNIVDLNNYLPIIHLGDVIIMSIINGSTKMESKSSMQGYKRLVDSTAMSELRKCFKTMQSSKVVSIILPLLIYFERYDKLEIALSWLPTRNIYIYFGIILPRTFRNRGDPAEIMELHYNLFQKLIDFQRFCCDQLGPHTEYSAFNFLSIFGLACYFCNDEAGYRVVESLLNKEIEMDSPNKDEITSLSLLVYSLTKDPNNIWKKRALQLSVKAGVIIHSDGGLPGTLSLAVFIIIFSKSVDAFQTLVSVVDAENVFTESFFCSLCHFIILYKHYSPDWVTDGARNNPEWDSWAPFFGEMYKILGKYITSLPTKELEFLIQSKFLTFNEDDLPKLKSLSNLAILNIRGQLRQARPSMLVEDAVDELCESCKLPQPIRRDLKFFEFDYLPHPRSQ